MFQLIVAVISIALVAALAIASIFYGGDAFTKSSTKAQVTTLINQGQQIAGAAALYKTDNGASPATVATLVPNYLAAAPTGTKNTDNAVGWELHIGATSAEASYTSIGIATGGAELCAEVVNQGTGSCDAGYTKFSFPL